MLKALRCVLVRSQRRVRRGNGCCASTRSPALNASGSTTSYIHVRIRYSSLLSGSFQHSTVRWNSNVGSSLKDDATENSPAIQKTLIDDNRAAADDDDVAVYPCFSDLDDLHSISKEMLHRAGLERMTEVQFKTWGPVLEGRDVIARARTGTGKTMAFLLPSLERIVCREDNNTNTNANTITTSTPTKSIQNATTEQKNNKVEILIISPTRELAQQIGQEAQLLTKGFATSSHSHERSISSATFFGGRPRALDVRAMEVARIPNILVVTPGRLLDHLNSTRVNNVPFRDLVQHVQVLVLDEMDSLLDLGFRDAIQEILCYLPQQRQTLLFSATMPPQVRDLIEICVAPNRVLVDCMKDEDPMTHTNERIDQTHVVLPLDKSVWGTVQIILELMKESNHKLLVFFPTTAQVCFFAKLFNLGLGRPVLEIHSRLAQNRRAQTSDSFRHSRRRRGVVMFTSDVSARGIDYPDVTHVIQVGMAPKRESYIHRLGRTGRAEKHGKGILILTEPEKIALETDLNGLDITENEYFQQMINTGHVSLELEEDRMRIMSQTRAGELPELETDAKAVYTGLLGFYFSKLRTLGLQQPQNVVVNIMNEFAAQAGLRERPTLPMKLAAQYRLCNHSGVNVREEWRAGRNFDVGHGRGRLSKNRFAFPPESSTTGNSVGGGDIWGDEEDEDNGRNSGGSKRTSGKPFLGR